MVVEVAGEEEDWSYRISNGAGMKRFLIFRLAAFQWAGAPHGAQALIPAPGSIIGVSSRSPRPRKPSEMVVFFFPRPLHHASLDEGGNCRIFTVTECWGILRHAAERGDNTSR